MAGDVPDAKALVLSEGRVAFDDVTFGYEAGASVLNNVSCCSACNTFVIAVVTDDASLVLTVQVCCAQ